MNPSTSLPRAGQATTTPARRPLAGLPSPGTMLRALARQLPHAILPLFVIGVAAWFTGNNIFHYPQYELDEGTYVSSAWTMITSGKMFYYTYTYAHPPLGWLQVGLWSVATGGFDRWGMAINSGRVFMLLVTVLSSLLIYWIVRIETGKALAGALAAVIFAASPLAVSLHRQVYLDNIGTLWLLVSLVLLQRAKGRFGHIALSAAAFGIAFLTKEVFVVLFPGMVLLVLAQAHPLQRRFSTVLWAAIAGALISLLILLAILKDELLPPGHLWSSSAPHVSLIETYTRQVDRGGGGLLNLQGSFWKNAQLWWMNGPLLVGAGAAALILCPLFWRKSRMAPALTVLAISFVVFLGRGGIVIYYYVIPLLAIMALAIGLVAGFVASFARRWRPARAAVASALLAASVVYTSIAAAANDLNFVVDNTTSQRLAAQWVARNVSPGSIIVMDSYAWQDFRDGSIGGVTFPNAHYYWPLFSDQDLVKSVLGNRWQSVDYLLVSPNTVADARSFQLPLMQDALSNADPVRTFSSGNWSQTIYRVRKLPHMRAVEDPILVRTWNGDKQRFISDGRVVVDRGTQESTSIGQGDAMMRALYANDRAAFDAIWQWTRANLQVRSGDLLLAASWQPGEGSGAPRVSEQASLEGDQQVALSLLFASRLWGDPAYEQSALEMLSDIWAHETLDIAGTRVAVSDDGGPTDGRVTVALTALSPAAYRIFDDADPDHAWDELVDSTYDLLATIRDSSGHGGGVGMAPDTVQIDAKTGKLAPAASDAVSTEGGELLWHLTLDYLWFQDRRAKDAIDGLHFYRDQLTAENGQLFASYDLTGKPTSGKPSMVADAGVVPSMLVTNDANLDAAQMQFAARILRNYTDTPSGAYWGKDRDDYAVQTSAWMTCALMDGAMVNLWDGDQVIRWSDVLPQLRH